MVDKRTVGSDRRAERRLAGRDHETSPSCLPIRLLLSVSQTMKRHFSAKSRVNFHRPLDSKSLPIVYLQNSVSRLFISFQAPESGLRLGAQSDLLAPTHLKNRGIDATSTKKTKRVRTIPDRKEPPHPTRRCEASAALRPKPSQRRYATLGDMGRSADLREDSNFKKPINDTAMLLLNLTEHRIVSYLCRNDRQRDAGLRYAGGVCQRI
jgi:hypothetical protein